MQQILTHFFTLYYFNNHKIDNKSFKTTLLYKMTLNLKHPTLVPKISCPDI